jgi:hypothetical protein
MYDQARALANECAEDAACYLEATLRHENQKNGRTFAGTKAAAMIGVFGNGAVSDQLIARLEHIDHPAVQYHAARAIDHLTPNGSSAVAKRLRAVHDRAERHADRRAVTLIGVLRDVLARLRAREKLEQGA